MTLRRVKEAALYAGFGFFCDLAATGYTLSVASNHPWAAVGCNLVLMFITWKVFLKINGWPCFISWIVGQSAGIWVAMSV